MSLEVDLDSILEEKHKKELKRTFQLMKDDSDRNGLSIFVRLFQEYPDYKRIFPKFRVLTDGEVSNSRELKDHGDLVFKELDGIMKSLDDPITVSLVLKRMARKHKVHSVQKKHLMNILPEILGVLKCCLDELTPLGEESWTLLITYIAELIEKIKLEKSSNPKSKKS